MSKNRILVVDDEPDLKNLILQKFRKKINADEYEFLFASNGVEALNVISDNNSVNLILVDINMPKMDGLTLLAKMNKLEQRLLRAVIVSAYGDMENIRVAMNSLGCRKFYQRSIHFIIEKMFGPAINDVNEYANDVKQSDDATCMALR